jgi:antagonist of KipI
MSGILVLRAGLLTTIQDGGRWGLQHQGVPVSGPMDPFAMRAANLAVGNDSEDAAFEVTLLGPELQFDGDAEIAVTGADLSAAIVAGGTSHRLPPGVLVRLPPGAILHFGERRSLARAYVAVRGGLDVQEVLGSRATSLQSGLPGLAGRALRSGDRIPIGTRAKGAPGSLRTSADNYRDPAVLRFIWGPDADLFSPDQQAAFVGTTYRVSPSSNRMGYRLEGRSIGPVETGGILSDATPIGSIQVPQSGEPILLMADRQTTGGYPRIGTLITADVGIAGQLAPGERLMFSPCSRSDALEALRLRVAAWSVAGGSG